MEQAVVTPVVPNAVIDRGKRIGEHACNQLLVQRFRACEGLLGVHGQAITAGGLTKLQQHAIPLPRVHRTVLEELTGAVQCHRRLGQPLTNFPRQTHRSPLALQQCLQEPDVPAQVVERHHRKALANQSVVGIVPLRALSVQPDAAVHYQVGELAQQRYEQLLE